jgi:ketosteroid isomerase-like protein
MRFDPEGIVEAALTAYALGDYETAAAFYAPHATFAFYAADEIFPFTGDWRGREAILACWHEIGAAFDIPRFEIRNISASQDVVRCQVDYELRHRTSGEVMDGVARCIYEIRDGLIVREREYNDVERLRAFMLLCGHAEEARQEVSAKRP